MQTEIIIVLLGALALVPILFARRRHNDVRRSVERRARARTVPTPEELEAQMQAFHEDVDRDLALRRQSRRPRVVGFDPRELEEQGYGQDVSEVDFEHDPGAVAHHFVGAGAGGSEPYHHPQIVDPGFQMASGNISEALAMGAIASPDLR